MTTKKEQIRTTREGPFRYFTCACGQPQAVNEVMPWCCKCVVEYDVNQASVTLRPDRKTERFAFAKALNATGGMRLGQEK
jgi:hypothetical protein